MYVHTNIHRHNTNNNNNNNSLFTSNNVKS